KVTRQYPGVQGFCDFNELLQAPVDAVLIATNIRTHYELAKRALIRGKHVFVEKPLADSSKKAGELAQIARCTGQILMAGNTFIYSPPVMKVKEILDLGTLGDVRYISMSRVNLG